MTENEKMLLKTDNKRKIKEMNGLNTDKEEFEMIETTLNISRNKLSQSEMNDQTPMRDYVPMEVVS